MKKRFWTLRKTKKLNLKEKISGLIITFNEEKNIQEVLECFDFCDEIIVVDSFSNDKTVEIAAKHPKVKIIQNKFEDFTKQRNLALENAKNDWVLFLDGDERITKELEKEIIETINDQLKNISQIEHSRHRSLTNYMINIMAGLVAYAYQDKKPALDLKISALVVI